MICGWSHSFFQASLLTLSFASTVVMGLYVEEAVNFLLRLAGVMVLVSGAASGIGVSPVESFWGEMVGDCNATRFLPEAPEDDRDGVLKAGSGRGIL